MEIEVAALLGAIMTPALQLLKALPQSWQEKLLTNDEEKRKARLQAGVLGVSLIVAVVYGVKSGVEVSDIDDLIAFVGMSVGVAYSTYQGFWKRFTSKK